MFNDTITLFNRYHSNTTGDTWFPHVLHNVHLITDKASMVAAYGQESSDSASLNIHYNNKTIERYNKTNDTVWNDTKEYYELNNGTYAISQNGSFDVNTDYYEKSFVEIMTIENIPFLSPKEWSKQTNDKLADSITFNDDAQLFDFFVVGDIGYTQPILDDNFKKGFYNVMNTKYDYCYAITSVGGPYKLIKHFELLAK